MRFRRFARVHILARIKQVTSSSEIRRYFRTPGDKKMNIGCGANQLAGWLNIDLHPRWGATYMDAGERWPIKDNMFSALLCEHMIEHVPKALANRLLAEAFRTLRPGGKIRLVTPDLKTFARMINDPSARTEGAAYIAMLEKFFGDKPISWCDAVNRCFYEHGHQYIYSAEELRASLRAAGFVEIVENRGGQPYDPAFHGVEGHVAVIGAEADAIEAFALEATKPG